MGNRLPNGLGGRGHWVDTLGVGEGKLCVYRSKTQPILSFLPIGRPSTVPLASDNSRLSAASSDLARDRVGKNLHASNLTHKVALAVHLSARTHESQTAQFLTIIWLNAVAQVVVGLMQTAQREIQNVLPFLGQAIHAPAPAIGRLAG